MFGLTLTIGDAEECLSPVNVVDIFFNVPSLYLYTEKPVQRAMGEELYAGIDWVSYYAVQKQ